MDEAADGQFDFVLTNPSSFVEMELNLGASAILTLRNKRQGKPYTLFGAVIFKVYDPELILLNEKFPLLSVVVVIPFS